MEQFGLDAHPTGIALTEIRVSIDVNYIKRRKKPRTGDQVPPPEEHLIMSLDYGARDRLFER